MRGFRAHEFFAGSNVAADITRGKAERTKTSDHEVGEILANAAPRVEHFVHRSGHGGGALIVAKLGEDPPRKIVHAG